MRKQFLILILLFYIPIVGQNIKNDSLQDQNNILELEKKVLILETKLETVDSTNTKILNTVYWTLGGLMSVFIAIIGLNFFQNFNLNRKKIDSIKWELNNELFKAINTMTDSILKTNKELKKELKEDIDSGIKTSFQSFDYEINRLKDNYKEVYRSELIRKAFEHKEKNQMGYILNLIELLKLDIEKGHDFRIHESLQLITDCLDSGFKGNSDSITRLNATLKKLPEEYDLQKKNIESKMTL
ncbi:hypothetical protein P8625_06445 [Tenacibaculum tangerinum]|uniref:Uncharacterized protein n=1 Tax=Tenacibaculum tangerinum TaxID=3038772 RepID=A0ABY8L9D1_9FLAO|nr:hypothetical protein [Tenacibaculum tangerinum]WGH76783.1 hypothetical protein P8625_06445 [Tenacibaculum tangerinum]